MTAFLFSNSVGQPTLIGVQAQSSPKHLNGKPIVWLGNKATCFFIVSRVAQTATFSAEACLTGPSRPEDKDRQIRISTGGNVAGRGIGSSLAASTLKPGLNFLDIARQVLQRFRAT